MAQTLATQHGGDPNPLDSTGLCLLSLDGGGVRGLSTLYILKSLMDKLAYERYGQAASNYPPIKPCELFDLIGGTSTGGWVAQSQLRDLANRASIIAIMLGRLEMDVDECIAAYNDLMKKVFSEKLNKVPVSVKGDIKPQFDSAALESAIKGLTFSRNIPETALLNDGVIRECRV
jgi:hypothetical protein